MTATPSPSPSPSKRRRTRRREANNADASVGSISRSIRCYDLLDEAALDRIEAQADQVLAEIGILFRDDPESVQLFVQAGARADGDKVFFPPGLVRSLTATAPRQFTHHGRNPARSVQVGGDNVVFLPAYGSPFVSCLDKGRRYASLDDFHNFVRLAYSSPWLGCSGGTVVEPVEIPVNKRHLDMVYAHIRDSDKPFLGSVTAPERAADSIEMARIAFGGKLPSDGCAIMGNVNSSSPLTFDGDVARVIRTYAAAGQGVIICPFIMGGAMGPVTPAASVAQAHAEAMVGVALTQLTRPGAPVVYGNFLTTLSLKSGAPTFGQPEAMLAYMAIGQLARRVGLPLRCGGHFTSSKCADYQAGQEAADAMTPALLSGANWILHGAGWQEGALTMGYEKFILDENRLGMMVKLLQGMAVDDNSLGYAAYAQREGGHNDHFFGTDHTMANYRTVNYESTTADCNSYEQWEANGSTSAEQRANKLWKQRLADYSQPPIDPTVDAELIAYIAQRKESMPDEWH